MKKHKKLIIGGLIILLAVAVLGYVGFMGGRAYYYDVGAYLAKGEAAFAQANNITGTVAALTRDSTTIRFALQDMKDSAVTIAVTYELSHGAVPDTFQEGRQAVVAGKYDPASQTFQATQIITKCSSKYEAE